MPTIALIGTLDSKGEEFALLKEQIHQRGHETLVIDVGVLEDPYFQPDITRHQVARAAGEDSALLKKGYDRGKAVAAMTRGVIATIQELHSQNRFQGLVGMGGSAGTSIATSAMRALPLGLPKLMVSTVAGGDVSGFVGVKDIIMFPSIVDISGLNRISRQVIALAAGAVCGMVETEIPEAEDKPVIAASMFGNTTEAVETARARLEEAGYEVLVFHAVGSGGRTMESLIEAGYISGVLDVTTTELADEVVGGVLSAGPHRLEAAARTGTPALVAPGCLDMVNFWAPETVPDEFADRVFYEHNPNVTLMRTTPEENQVLGKLMADKLNMSEGPVTVYIPLQGISVISAPGQPFHSPEADQAFLGALKSHLRSDISVIEVDANINDPEFANSAAEALLDLIEKKGRR